jgi:hypothetical protein
MWLQGLRQGLQEIMSHGAIKVEHDRTGQLSTRNRKLDSTHFGILLAISQCAFVQQDVMFR